MTRLRHAASRAALGLAIASAGPIVVAAMQVRGADPSWIAPPAAAERLNPLASRPEAAAGGRKLFDQRCASCHGSDGRGTEKAPDLTDAAVQAQTDGALFWKIGSGNTHAGMPAFSFLPELQRWQLVLHLRTLVP